VRRVLYGQPEGEDALLSEIVGVSPLPEMYLVRHGRRECREAVRLLKALFRPGYGGAPEPLAPHVVADFRQLVGGRGCLAALGEERVAHSQIRAIGKHRCRNYGSDSEHNVQHRSSQKFVTAAVFVFIVVYLVR
jgi:hypothetical protein